MNPLKIVKIVFFYLLLTFSSIVKSEQTTVYIDMNYVIQNSLAGKSITNKLINLNAINLKNFTQIEKKLKINKDKIVSQKNVIDKIEYDKLVLKIKDEIKEYKKLRQLKKNEIDKKKNFAVAELLKNINQILAIYSDEKNIALIIDKRNIIIGKKKLEITGEILKLVNDKVKNISLK